MSDKSNTDFSIEYLKALGFILSTVSISLGPMSWGHRGDSNDGLNTSKEKGNGGILQQSLV